MSDVMMEYLPDPHVEHVAVSETLVTVEDVSAGHATHVVADVVLEYLPAGHGIHTDTVDVMFEYLPTAQTTQVVTPGLEPVSSPHRASHSDHEMSSVDSNVSVHVENQIFVWVFRYHVDFTNTSLRKTGE